MIARRFAGTLPGLLAAASLSGCTLGPKGLEVSQATYNQAIQANTYEQLLLSLVRLPSPLELESSVLRSPC